MGLDAACGGITGVGSLRKIEVSFWICLRENLLAFSTVYKYCVAGYAVECSVCLLIEVG